MVYKKERYYKLLFKHENNDGIKFMMKIVTLKSLNHNGLRSS